jgi:CRP/FNR family cyclic AMP-dependent transcriptional regulator
MKIMPVKKPAKALKTAPEFDLEDFLESAGLARTIAKYAKAGVIYSQGDHATQVMYIQHGSAKISVLSKSGKEAVVAMLSAGDFLGEGCLAGQTRRMATATAMSPTTLLVVEKPHMMQMLHKEPALSDRFRLHMLMRNIRIEEDLIDQLFNSSEKRLARALLLMARYGEEPKQQQVVHELSQETLAEMVGTTRSRFHRIQRRVESQQLAAQRRPSRLSVTRFAQTGGR